MTKFADMSNGSRNGWLLWANSHDWGQSKPAQFYTAMDDKVYIVVESAVHVPEIGWTIEQAMHETPGELRAWAGY